MRHLIHSLLDRVSACNQSGGAIPPFLEVKMAHWKKDNGDVIELNDEPATVEYAESLGWKKVKAPAKKAAKKKAE